MMFTIMTLITKCCYAECRVCFFAILSVIMLNVVMLNVAIPIVMLNVEASHCSRNFSQHVNENFETIF
jgi:hypothetical protein